MDKELYAHYYKKVPNLYIDVYRVLDAFEVSDPCVQHAIKKLLAAGKRGSKDAVKDINEAIVSLERWKDMRFEEEVDSGSFFKLSPDSIRGEMQLVPDAWDTMSD